jgi:hypothetical protein
MTPACMLTANAELLLPQDEADDSALSPRPQRNASVAAMEGCLAECRVLYDRPLVQ